MCHSCHEIVVGTLDSHFLRLPSRVSGQGGSASAEALARDPDSSFTEARFRTQLVELLDENEDGTNASRRLLRNPSSLFFIREICDRYHDRRLDAEERALEKSEVYDNG